MDNDSEEQLLKILSNPIRSTIVKKLYDDSFTFTHLMQITGCKTGQLSFHLKKLDYLVEQDELKRYRLSKKGKEDVEAILPMLGSNEKENNDSWNNLPGDEDNVQLGYAFKQFWDSLGLLIFSFSSAVKHGIVYVLDSLKIVAGLSSINRDVHSTFSIVKDRIISVMKSTRKSLNPILCYFFLILGLLLFIPAVFSLSHPGFDSVLDSAARLNPNEMTPEEISLANDLYGKEMLPYQRNFQENNYSDIVYKAMYYEYKVAFPLSAQKIEAWNEAKIPARVQFGKDLVLSCFSLSLILLLLGGILTYRRDSLLSRILNSTIAASILLILISIFALLITNIVWGYGQVDQAVLKSASLMLKHLIALLLLLLFSSVTALLLMKKKGQKAFTENESEAVNNIFLSDSQEKVPAQEILDRNGRCVEEDQVYLKEKRTSAGDTDNDKDILVKDEDEGIYYWDERKGTAGG